MGWTQKIDSERCLMISTRMSAKQLYFPRISRAQRGPFFGRNPLFVKGSTPRLRKQLAWSSSHADSTTFALSEIVRSGHDGCPAHWASFAKYLCYPPFWLDLVFFNHVRAQNQNWIIGPCSRSVNLLRTCADFSSDVEKWTTSWRSLCRLSLSPLENFLQFVPFLTVSASQLSKRVLRGSTWKNIWSSLAAASVRAAPSRGPAVKKSLMPAGVYLRKRYVAEETAHARATVTEHCNCECTMLCYGLMHGLTHWR